MEGGTGWSWGWGWDGAREGWGGDASLNVAAVEGVALKVRVDVLHAGQLHAVLVHAPADATFAATGRLALWWRERQLVKMAVPRGGSTLAWPFVFPLQDRLSPPES